MAYKQHFIEWFSGKQLPSYWTSTQFYGNGSDAMSDEVDGGYKITGGNGGSSQSQIIGFNDKCQFSHQGSVFNTVIKMSSTNNIVAKVGLKKNTTGNFNDSNASFFGDSTVGNFEAFSGDESARSGVSSSIALNTSWNNHKLTLQTANFLYHINGVLEVTKTTNLPTVVNLQPSLQIVNLNTTVKSISCRFLEVYNT